MPDPGHRDCVPRRSAYFERDIANPVMAAIETPCEKLCILDDASGLCRGCGRSLDEIARWSAYSDAERARVTAELPRRLAALEPDRSQAAAS